MKLMIKVIGEFIHSVPDAIKVSAAGATAYILAIIDVHLPDVINYLEPIIILVKYGTAILLLLYMTIKTYNEFQKATKKKD